MELHRRDAIQGLEVGASKKNDDSVEDSIVIQKLAKINHDNSFYWNNRTFRIIGILSAILLVPWFLYTSFKEGYFDQNVDGKVMVIYSMPETYFTKQQGMFAEFEAVVGALHYAEIHNALALRVNFIETSFYTRNEGENWWAYYFEPNMTIHRFGAKAEATSLEGHEEVHFNHWVARFGRLGSFMQVINGKQVDSRHPWPIRGGFDTLRANQLVERYIRLAGNDLLGQVDALINKVRIL
jgi:uncharacterized membrane protein